MKEKRGCSTTAPFVYYENQKAALQQRKAERMRKFGEYTKWMLIFLLGVALIAVYKTFDNLGDVLNGILEVLRVLRPFVAGFILAYILNLPCKKIAILCQKSRFTFLKRHEKGISVAVVYC